MEVANFNEALELLKQRKDILDAVAFFKTAKVPRGFIPEILDQLGECREIFPGNESFEVAHVNIYSQW